MRVKRSECEVRKDQNSLSLFHYCNDISSNTIVLTVCKHTVYNLTNINTRLL